MPLHRTNTLRTRLFVIGLNFVAGLARSRRGSDVATRSQNEGVARIAVLELWNIGDVILVMPFLAQLRRRFPRAKISLVSRPLAEDLLAGTGLVDEVVAADLTWISGPMGRLPRNTLDTWSVGGELRRRGFDIAFSSRLHLREHLLLALSGAKRTVGYPLANAESVLTDPVALGDGQSHKVADWLRLLEPFGGGSSVEIPRLHVSDAERHWAKGYLTSRGVPQGGLVIGIHPGASMAEKRWPLEGFRDVVIALGTQPGVRVLAFAEPSGFGSDLFALPGVVGAQVGLRELIALISRCDLLLCNDSGPMHIAGVLGVPTVALFGSGIERWFAPLGEGHEILKPAEEAATGRAASGIRRPAGIEISQVLDAVGRVVQRLRQRGL
jgi:heptosyltransferase-2